MKLRTGNSPDFIVVSARSRNGPALIGSCCGDQVEHVIVDEQLRQATVIYAADLGRAVAAAVRLRAGDHQLILVDLHATVANSLAEWRTACARVADSLEPNRLSYSGTVSGLKSYLSDLSLLDVVDGAIVSVVKYVRDDADVTCADVTESIVALISNRLASD